MAVANELTIIIRAIDATAGATASAQAGLRGTALSMQRATNSMQQFNREVASATKIVGALSVALATGLAKALTETIAAFAKYEQVATLFAIKSGMAQQEVEVLLDSLLELKKAMPVTRDEMAGLALEAAKLGIETKSGIEAATIAAIHFEQASGGLVKAQAAMGALGKIAIAMKAPFEAIGAIGSAIVYLADQSAAEVPEVLEETQKLAALGQMFQLTTDQIAAMVTTVINYGNIAGRTGLRLSRILQLVLQNHEAIAAATVKLADRFDMVDDAFVRSVKSGTDVLMLARDPIQYIKEWTEFLNRIPDRLGRMKELQASLGWMFPYFVPLVEGGEDFLKFLDMAHGKLAEGTELQRQYEILLQTLSKQSEVFSTNLLAAVQLLGEGLAPPLRSLYKDVLVPFSQKLIDITKQFRDIRKAGGEVSWVVEVTKIRLEGITEAIRKALLEGDYSGILHELAIGVGAITLMVKTWKLAAAAIVALKAYMATTLGGMVFGIGTAILSAHFVLQILPEEIRKEIERLLGPLGKSEFLLTVTLGFVFAVATGATKWFLAALAKWAKTLPALSSLTVGTGALPFLMKMGWLAYAGFTLVAEIDKVTRGKSSLGILAAKLGAAAALGIATWAVTKNMLAASIMATAGFNLIPSIEEIRSNPNFAIDLAARLTAALAAFGMAFAFTGNKWVATISASLVLTFLPDVGGFVDKLRTALTGEGLRGTPAGDFALAIREYAEILRESIVFGGKAGWSADWYIDLQRVLRAIEQLAKESGTTAQDLANYWTNAVEELRAKYPDLADYFTAITNQIQRAAAKFGDAGVAVADAFVDGLTDVVTQFRWEDVIPDLSPVWDALGYDPLTRPQKLPYAEQFEAWLTGLDEGTIGINTFITNVMNLIRANQTNVEAVNMLSGGLENLYTDVTSAAQTLEQLGLSTSRAHTWMQKLGRVLSVEAQFRSIEMDLLRTGDTVAFVGAVTGLTAANLDNIDAINAISGGLDSLMSRLEDAADFLEIVFSPDEAAAFRSVIDVLALRFGKASRALESFTERLSKATVSDAVGLIRQIVSYAMPAIVPPAPTPTEPGRPLIAVQQAEQAIAVMMRSIGEFGIGLRARLSDWENRLAQAAAAAKVAAEQTQPTVYAPEDIGMLLRTPAGQAVFGTVVTFTSELQSAISMIRAALDFLETAARDTADIAFQRLILESDIYNTLRATYDELRRQFGPEIVPFTVGEAKATRIDEDALADAIARAVAIIAPEGSVLPELASVVAALVKQDYIGAIHGVLELGAKIIQQFEQAVDEVRAALWDLAERARDLVSSFVDLVMESEQLTAVQRALAQVQSALVDTLLGFLSPIRWVIEFVLGFFEEEAEDAAEEVRRARKSVASLNIPTGYKLDRAAWGVATPGQPWREEEDLGDAERRIRDVFANVPRWLKEIIERFRAALEEAGQGIKAFIEKMQAIWQELAPVVIGALLPVLRYFGEALGWVADEVRARLLPVLVEHLPAILGNLGRAFADLVSSGLVVLAGFIANVAVPVIGTFAEALAGAAQWVRNMLVPDILNLFAGIGNWWRSDVDPFLKAKVFPQLGEWIERFRAFIANKLLPFLENRVWPWLSNFIENKLFPLLNRVFDLIEKHWPAIENWIMSELENWANGLMGKIDLFVAGFLVLIGDKWAAIQHIWNSESLTLWDKVKTIFAIGLITLEGQLAILGIVLLGVALLFGSPVAIIIGAVMAVVGILSFLAGGFQNLLAFIGNLISGFGAAIGRAIQGIGSFLWNVIQGIGSFLWGIIQGIGSALLFAANLIWQPIKWIINGVIALVNGIIWLINLIPGVNIPSIPYLEKGGHVLEEGLAYLHRGETVVPARTSAYSDQIITIHEMTVVANDPESFMEQMEAAIRRKNLRGTGRRYGSYATVGY